MFCTKCGKKIELNDFFYYTSSKPGIQPQMDTYSANGLCDCPKPKLVIVTVQHEYVN